MLQGLVTITGREHNNRESLTEKLESSTCILEFIYQICNIIQSAGRKAL